MTYLLGPELIWLLAWILIYLIGKQNAAPPHRFNRLLEKLHSWIAPILVLTFLLFRVPFVEQAGLIIRIWIAGLLGAHIFLKTGLSAHSEQGPGVAVGSAVNCPPKCMNSSVNSSNTRISDAKTQPIRLTQITVRTLLPCTRRAARDNPRCSF